MPLSFAESMLPLSSSVESTSNGTYNSEHEDDACISLATSQTNPLPDEELPPLL